MRNPDTSYWREVARLIEFVAALLNERQSALVKMDGFRKSENFYTVLLRGGPDEGPAFRSDCGNLRDGLRKLVADTHPLFPTDNYESERCNAIGMPLALADDFSHKGVVVGLDLEAIDGQVQYEVWTDVPYLRTGIARASGFDLKDLLEQVVGASRLG